MPPASSRVVRLRSSKIFSGREKFLPAKISLHIDFIFSDRIEKST